MDRTYEPINNVLTLILTVSPEASKRGRRKRQSVRKFSSVICQIRLNCSKGYIRPLLWVMRLRTRQQRSTVAEDPIEGSYRVVGPRLRFSLGGREEIVEQGNRSVDVAGRRVRFEEVRDLLHLGNPAIGLVVHPRNVAAHPREHLRLAVRQFGDQRLRTAEARRTEQHRRGGADRPIDGAQVDPPVA